MFILGPFTNTGHVPPANPLENSADSLSLGQFSFSAWKKPRRIGTDALQTGQSLKKE